MLVVHMSRCECMLLLTNNHPNFTAAILVIAGNHGGYCVIHHGNHIHLKVLNDIINITMQLQSSTHIQALNICLELFIIINDK